MLSKQLSRTLAGEFTLEIGAVFWLYSNTCAVSLSSSLCLCLSYTHTDTHTTHMSSRLNITHSEILSWAPHNPKHSHYPLSFPKHHAFLECEMDLIVKWLLKYRHSHISENFIRAGDSSDLFDIVYPAQCLAW